MYKPKISVVMGVYNPKDGNQLYQATMSIVNQRYRDWEMIICDDGTDEAYVETVKAAAELDNRIKYIRCDENRGLANALNQGIHIAQGKYIARMDADDISQPQRLGRLYEFLEVNPQYQWVGSNSNLFDDNGIWGKGIRKETPQKNDFLKYSPYIHPSVMFRREILIEINGYTVSDLTARCEDYELFMRLHKHGYKGFNIQEELYNYREDVNSYRKRKYTYCIREMQIRSKGFRELGIKSVKTIPYVIKPLVVGLIRPRLAEFINKNLRKSYYAEEQRSSQI